MKTYLFHTVYHTNSGNTYSEFQAVTLESLDPDEVTQLFDHIYTEPGYYSSITLVGAGE